MSSRKLVIAVLALLCSVVGQCIVTGTYALAVGVPLVVDESASGIGTTSVTLRATINTNEESTSYHFEYGTDKSYGANVPVPDAGLSPGIEDSEVIRAIGGLQPGIAYHYRLVAVSSEGTTYGSDRTFNTFAVQGSAGDSCPNAAIRGMQLSFYLPDCRAYEMVSPVEKNGGNVAADSRHTQSSIDGNAVKYTSLVAYGDAQGIEARGAEYLAQRGSEGWITHAINPVQNEGEVAFYASSVYLGFSEDLSRGIYYARLPITSGHPNVEKVGNLYLRTDILSAAPGSYELLSDAVAPVPARSPFDQSQDVGFDGASADWSRFIFETSHNLTSDTASLSPEVPKLYEWHAGIIKLVGILPNGTPAESSVAGGGNRGSFTQARHTISTDGSRIIFETGPFEEEGVVPVRGGLYMRINGTETVQLNASERSEPGSGSDSSAIFMGATPDDSKVLFTSSERLTNDTIDRSNLYMYDTSAPAGKHLTLLSVDQEPSDLESSSLVSVVGASQDLSYIYFVDDNKLLAGQANRPEEGQYSGTRLYVWHEGTVRLVMDNPEFAGAITPDWGERGPEGESEFRLTPDGKEAVFATASSQLASLSGYDNRLAPNASSTVELNNCAGHVHCKELYMYKYDAAQLTCISCDPSGARPVGDAKFERLADVYPAYGFSWPSQVLNRPLTPDGHYVFFDTRDALVASDTNGHLDVYEYDSVTKEVHLLSNGTCGCESEFVNADESGDNVFIATHQPLVRSDRDTNGDLYDVRVDGGILAQNQVPAPPCEGDDCQGPALPAPVFSVPASSAFAGIGNARLAPGAGVKASPRSVSRLARALKICKAKPRRVRARCRSRARKLYIAKRSTNRRSRRVGQ